MKRIYPEPYSESDITQINTTPKVDYVALESMHESIKDMIKKVDEILKLLKEDNETAV